MTAPLSEAQRALMARLLRGEAAPSAPTRIPRRDPDAVVPISAAQRQVWLDAALSPDVPIYNESITLHRRGSFDEAALRASLDTLMQRHEAWRTSFGLDGGEPIQIIHPSVALTLPIDDVSHLPSAAARDAAALALATADARIAIDMTVAPLIRARVVRMAPDDHRLYLTLHHIIFDGVAISRVIVPELATLYEAFAAGRPNPLPDPALGYGDYTVWHERQLAGDGIQRQLAHWRSVLADAPPRFDLVGDRPRAAIPARAGSMETFHVPALLTDRLRQLARDQGATLYMVLLAAFSAMLHRYSGEEDIVIAGVTDLRRRAELHDVVGYFLNTFALRTRPSADLGFDAHLAAVRTTVAGALGASELPFDEVVRALRIKREKSGHPLFSILFSIQPPADPIPAGWDMTQMDVVVGGAKFDLYFELDEQPDGMAARFMYDIALFDAATIQRMIGHWLTLLDGVAADPRRALGALPLLTRPEADQLRAWNGTAHDLPSLTLPEAVATQARRTPDARAVSGAGIDWSYAALDAAADRIARRLAAAHVGTGALVAIAVDRSPVMVAALLGTLRAGAAYLPLDAGHPRSRLEWIIGDARPDLVLTETRLMDALPTGELPRLLVDRDDDPLTLPAPFGPSFDDLAYIIYTSGSTGVPKGVEIGHRALANFLDAMRTQPGFTAHDSLLAVTTLTFDIAALELFLPLTCGGRIAIAPTVVAHDPIHLMQAIATERPSVMQATPATWLGLLEAGWRGDRGLTILCGGEALPRTLADRLLDCCAGLWNMYGPTEATVWATIERVDRSAGPISIGRPIANMTADVLDVDRKPVPAGIVGELFLGGAGLALGYHGRPDLTRDRFQTVGDDRLYRTGDLVRRRSDGALIWLGRADNEEKIRGYRIAVEEVEGAIAADPSIAAAAVRGIPDASGMRTLIAWIVRAGEIDPDISALRTKLEAALPDYMVPGRFILVDRLPMTASGKIDRKALVAPADSATVSIATPPCGAAEERLARLWCDVLQLETFDRTDSFFDLGGHSLLATRLLRRIEAEYDRRLDMAALFRARRFDDMVAALEAPPIDPDLVIPIQPHGSQPPLFWLSAGPAQLALADMLGPDQPFLGVPIGTNPEVSPEHGFADHAAEVVRRLLLVRPQGPYLIGGWCTAGILAFEVARMLRARGADVPLLIIGDSIDPSWHGDPLRRIVYHLRRLSSGPDEGRMRYLFDQSRKALMHFGLIARPPVPDIDDAGSALNDAARRYVPGDYAGRVLLFRSSDWDARLGRGGWPKRMRGPIEDHVFPGDHEGFFGRAFVGPLASLLRDRLANRTS